ncbi:HEAT repeat domain-containing protein [Marinifilum sp. D737]|uniref:HEAT repeat domain-containing protein n=1 Tax=Marinifilum sp. D737 TaxID=2969628 RepID=UPI0022732E5E|nr:zf-HC2 domain-containing protein [Marinifilum sp. D737]MCY1636650.1 HEAT repeat domain-containing protein [Marinifilum sp. D737]
MNCKYIQDLLIEYLENNLNQEQANEVENHLISCENCRNEYQLTKQFLHTINDIEDEQPSANLSMNFNQLLEEEKENQRQESIQFTDQKENHYKFGEFLKYAAAILIIFGLGFLLGKNLPSTNDQSMMIASLQSDLHNMKQNLTMATLKQPTSSQRLKAVNLLEEHSQADDKVLSTLVQTLQSDANVNVRMAAANALVKFSNDPLVKNAFLEALKNQKEPSLQITLINILVNLQDERAKDLLQDILNEENNLPVVKELAREGIKVFI